MKSVSRVVPGAVLLVCVVAPSLRAAAEPPQKPESAAEELLPYYVSPGDVLRIAVWKEPELTTDVFVRLDGMITVPPRRAVRTMISASASCGSRRSWR